MPSDESDPRRRRHAALATTSRLRLLEVLRAGDRALDVRELAAATGLHLTTVRAHLERLRGSGLVRSRTEPEGRPGRRRVLYAATTSDPAAPPDTGYQLLAGVLASHLGRGPAERAQRAERTGRAWAAELLHTQDEVSREQALEQVMALFTEVGFEPETVADDHAGGAPDSCKDEEGVQIRLHACPFREVAEQHEDVVCSLHLGLLHGALDRLGTHWTAESLVPFVEPHLCVAHLVPQAAS